LLDLRLTTEPGNAAAVALIVAPPPAPPPTATAGGLVADDVLTAFLADVDHAGTAGTVHVLPRPGQRPRRLLLVGVGDGSRAGWRSAGAALARAARREESLAVVLPAGHGPDAVPGLVEGSLLASYRYRVGSDDADRGPRLRRIDLVTADPAAEAPAFDVARVVARTTVLARDLTNTASNRKNPAWLARQIEKAAAGTPGLTVRVREPAELEREGFGGILAVGRGSISGPRLVELGWRPRGARTHVVLVGKGITFDTGGISIKPRAGMKLMRKDMGGGAAVLAATIGAAALRLRVRVTAVVPMAENAVGADAYRPGDVVRHYGGRTTEVTNTDAEGRVVLADALVYAVQRLRPDIVVDLATLTGAQGVALGKRTAALFSDSDTLAATLAAAAREAGELLWRMPLPADYLEHLASDVADLTNSSDQGAGALVAALYLREFTGAARGRWAHLDMSSSAWSDSVDGELAKGATGWGVRTLLRWLESLAASRPTPS